MGYRNGLYYESLGIRNSVLERNIGEYRGYRQSMLYNGGLAIGMPYAVETELTPWTLAERSQDGLHLNLAITKDMNPRINVAFREGGLFGYTHEVINHPFDPLMRNYNIFETYYDYDSTEDVKYRLNKVYDSFPWGRSDEPWSERGLRPYSDHNQPQNAEYFDDYTGYANAIFLDGLSFQKTLGEGYSGRLLVNGFNREDVDTSPIRFIDDWAGRITDNISERRAQEDTKLGYIGRILLDEAKVRRYTNERQKTVSPVYEVDNLPGINNEFFAKYSPASIENFASAREEELFDGRDYDAFGFKPDGGRYIEDLDVVMPIPGEIDTFFPGETQKNLLKGLVKRNLRRGGYANLYVGGDYMGYAKLTNLDVTSSLSIDTDIKSPAKDNPTYTGDELHTGSSISDRVYHEYDERDESGEPIRDRFNVESYGNYTYSGINDAGENNLLAKTKELFAKHKINTLVGRFHTSGDNSEATEVSLTQTAVDKTWGMSHGRNLLKTRLDSPNDYTNPYCRVWTYHHQYSKMTDLIRPFSEDGHFTTIDSLQMNYPGRPILSDGVGRGSWAEKTVLNKNGMVNIAPMTKISQGDVKKISAKQCMFSIENLAWKGVLKDKSTIDPGEEGPLGGRIMWFPPYNLQFNESVSVNWGGNDFIGRGERIYTYTNTERSGTLSFTILADHPSILNYWLNSDSRRTDLEKREEDQQKVLRFFAGCDTLEVDKETLKQTKGGVTERTLGIRENQKNDPKPEQDKTDVNPDETKDPEPAAGPPPEFTKDNSIGFYVYFPNNLSGVDFMANPKIIVNYLVNGKNGFELNTEAFPNKEDLLKKSSGSNSDWSDRLIINTGGTGYEMHRGYLTDDNTASLVMEFDGKPENDKGRNYIWGYGVDYDSRYKRYKERLCGPYGDPKKGGSGSYKIYPKNYVDSTDFGLNYFGNQQDEACAYSFMDVAEAITTDFDYTGKGRAEEVAKIKEILGLGENKVKNGGGRKYYFGIAGGASVHGNKNVSLSQLRASFVMSWLQDCFKKLNLQVDFDETAKIPVTTGIAGGEDALDINSESAKRGRYAKAVIYWNDEDVKDATDAEVEYVENDESLGIYTETVVDDNLEDVASQEEAAESPAYLDTVSITDLSTTRYGDEELFFEMLEESDPAIYKNIVDKVRFFDPVYHSITPEGFNARLSFLHQCTRQGPTMSSSDLAQNRGINGAGYAGNLAFGRAPVCVLRLGDFYNTRIVINSLSIQYETAQWDLNPEGIGVQPMLANVTLGFVFQGGSSLGGPIQRLQNAVSFNYYANQEVYDDRADVAVYKDNEFDNESSLIWLPGYGNMAVGSVQKIMYPPQDTTIEQIASNKSESQSVQSNIKMENAMDTIAKAGEGETANGDTGQNARDNDLISV